MKGIILAGGSGSRLYPMTLAVNKQLLPLYNKPLIYYPLSLLISCGLKDILLISSEGALPQFRRLLSDGLQWGINLEYALQERPEGIAQALLIAEEFLAGEGCVLILGDNLFIAPPAVERLRELCADQTFQGAQIFACRVQDPERYGVLSLAEDGRVLSILEKPAAPPSPFAVTGLYCYDGTAPQRARRLRPSARGELEITDLNLSYLKDGALAVLKLPRGCAWLDAGTPASLLDAADYVRILETRQGVLIGSPELTAYKQGFICAAELKALAAPQLKTQYGQSLLEAALEDKS